MTENEAKTIDDCLKELRGHRSEYLKRSTPWRIINRAVRLIIELKEYKEIGTIEDFKALKEKSEPKEMDGFYCPICRHYFEYTDAYNYCPVCGQKMKPIWQ